MSGKLDQALDDIVSTRRAANDGKRKGSGKRPARRAAVKAKAAIVAPVGGVQKQTKAGKVATAAPALPTTGDSKIIISNLPEDVSESLIKDFFAKSVGSVKKVLLSYGPTGRSRGEATVIFGKPTAAAKAREDFHNVKVDGRPMRVEIVGGSQTAVGGPKALQDRMAKPKNAAEKKEKNTASAKANNKSATNGTATKGGRGEKKKSGRAGRPKPKTAQELDAEMQDYFGDNTMNGQAAVNGTAQPATVATAGDTGMEDNIA